MLRSILGKSLRAIPKRAESEAVGAWGEIYGPEHLQMQDSLRKIIEQDINPNVPEWEKAGIYPAHEVMKKLGSAGFLGTSHPEEYGGMGLDYSYTVAVSETLGEIKCGGIPMSIGVQFEMATPALGKFGSETVCEEFLRPSIAGDKVACLGVSEVHAGSDVAQIKTTAKSDGDDYIINGQKMWITNGIQADWCCLLANTSDGPVHKSKSLICVPMDLPGVIRAKKIEKIGMWSSDTAQLWFEDVRVPKKYIIGEEGSGFIYQMIQFQQERIFAMASAISGLENCINETINYTRERQAFGKSVLDNQYIHFQLAELQTEVELLRALLYRVTAMYVNGEDATKLASMGKLKTGRLIREVADKCLQMWGGMGYTLENPVSQQFRDGRLASVGGGADEIMLQIICKLMDILPKGTKLV
ncbi:unnamed protein product [Oikopleura dioica]|uniref:Acyl-CoA dehydrogenase 6 n=1 Tax=Oikopleura dioica TaxID=34765 RepID=E4XAQ0_OIKDI|nr:unnamed protein product [Oikopleura dioica]